uniref:Ig-like domain-containing protein n=1 Tax=Paramormyrops kingsleyae TaxID=1676925 RepID=A0A3B3R931_9TELE
MQPLVIKIALLTLESNWTEIFTTESVTLRCGLQGDSAEWEYKWYRDQKEIQRYETGHKYRILSVTRSDTGQYTCRGQYRRRRVLSEMSNDISITVSGRMFYESLQVCGLQGDSAQWEYKWYRDGQEIPPYGPGDKYTITKATLSDSGGYTCRGQYRGRRRVLCEMSNDLPIKISGRKVLCTSTWHNQQEIPKYEAGDKYRILSVTRSDTGQYTCRGQHRNRTVFSEMSDDISITVSALPKAVLTLESGWTEIFITENVTLRCDLQVGSAEWEYKWYKNNQEILKSGAGHQHTILSANPSDTGGYACRGQYRRRTHVSSEMSSTLQINIAGRFFS